MDHRPHDDVAAEWWYFNAHLTSSDGDQLSLFLAFFRVAAADAAAPDGVRRGAMLHWGRYLDRNGDHQSGGGMDRDWLEIQRHRTRADTNLDLNLRQAVLEVLDADRVVAPDRLIDGEVQQARDRLRLVYGDLAFLEATAVGYRIGLNTPETGRINLHFAPRTPAVAHGRDGVVPGPEGKPDEAMAYYFHPGGAVSGVLRADGGDLAVTGVGWLDHEWGGRIDAIDAAPDPERELTEVTWDWAGLHLEGGWNLSFQVVADAARDSGQAKERHRILIGVGPEGQRWQTDQFRLEASEWWTSLLTFNQYPSRWELTCDEHRLRLILTASGRRQECVAGWGLSFWEGRVSVAGLHRDDPVSGVGFVETLPAQVPATTEGRLFRPADEVTQHARTLYPDTVCPADLAGIVGAESPMMLAGVPCEDVHAGLVAPVRHLLDHSGKCWRGFLSSVVMQLTGVDPEPYRGLMTAIELLHAAAMMIDDIEDRSAVRRGAPAAHVVFGEPLTINAGTALYFVFDRIMRSLPDLPDSARLAAYLHFGETLRATHAGQALDLLGGRDAMDAAVLSGDAAAVEERVLAGHRLKTAAPIRGIALIGAAIGQAGPQLTTALDDYFTVLGTVYQMADDVLDLRGPNPHVRHKDRSNRAVGDDIRTGKVSYPLVAAITLLPRPQLRELWAIVQTGPQDPATVAHCIEVLAACGALDATIQRAAAMIDEAWSAFAPHVGSNRAAVAARAIGLYAVHRDDRR